MARPAKNKATAKSAKAISGKAKKVKDEDVIENEDTQSSASDAWFERGASGFQKRKDLETARKLRREKSVKRFWLREDRTINGKLVKGEANIIFVDSDAFWIWEHQFYKKGTMPIYLTCVAEYGKRCPICEAGNNKPMHVAYLTVIDTRSYEKSTKDGGKETVKNERVLLPVKGVAQDILEETLQNYGDLTGMAFTVRRRGDKDPNCGREFTRFGKGTLNLAKELGKESAIPYDYEKIFAPPSKEEYAAVSVFDEPSVGSEGDIGSGSGNGKSESGKKSRDVVESDIKSLL